MVALIDDNPFIFTGTLRDNIDPFQQYTDEQIIEALIRIGMWNQLPFSDAANEAQEKLHMEIDEGATNLSLGH